MGVVVHFVYNGIYDMLGVSKLYNIIALAASVGIRAVLYGVLCYAFRVKEVRDIVSGIYDRLSKGRA